MSSRPLVLVAAAGLLALTVSQTACRSCSPEPTPQHAEPADEQAAEPAPNADQQADAGAAAEPGPGPNPAVAAGDAGPPPTAQQLPTPPEADALVAQLNGTASFDVIRTGLRQSLYYQAVDVAVRDYMHCRSVRDPSVCDRLPENQRDKCRLEPSQVAARQQSEHGWMITDAALAWCRGGHMDEGPCRQFGLAVETHAPDQCASLPGEAAAYCRAMASGDAHNCDFIPRETSCRREVQFYDLLRAGIPAFQQRADEYYHAYAVGLDPSADACTTLARTRFAQEITRVTPTVPPLAPAGAPLPPPANPPAPSAAPAPAAPAPAAPAAP